MEHLTSAMTELQKKTIGILNSHGYCEFVISDDETTVTTIYIGKLGGISESHYPKSKIHYISVPTPYESLYDIMQDVYAFYDWSKQFDK